MNLENMSREELLRLHEKVSDKLGFYHFSTVCLTDIVDRLTEMKKDGLIETIPPEETIRAACSYVWRKHDGGDWMDTVDWITETALEYAERDRKPVLA